jgi:uncharacterized protein YndB with AHSA1/START domain
MNETATQLATQNIVVEEVFPHAPEVIWKTLTTGDLIGRWLRMSPTGFDAVKGTRFTFQTKSAGEWDGVIHCEVLEVIRNERLSYSWQGGHDSNGDRYGSLLNTVVTWTLLKVAGGTKLHLLHSGFVTPRNNSAFKNMSEGWKTVVGTIGTLAGDPEATGLTGRS